MFSLIGFLVVGFVAGLLGRFLVPGRDPMGCVGTTLLGVAGSFMGGLLGSMIFNGELDLRASNNFIGAVLGAVIALLAYRSFAGRRRH
jgi:uncharacterized membrane protein YeaQ/YmgE (transglycosylase-associated protein family)